MKSRRRLVKVARKRIGRIARAVGVLPPSLPPPDRGKVAIVVPAFNESTFLAQTLESIKAQTYPHWRVIIIDDQSSDATTRIAADHARSDPRFQVFRMRRNGGLPAARNAGLAQVTEPFVVFLDGDDALYPTCLQRRVNTLVEDTGAAGSFGVIRQVPADMGWRDAAKLARKTTRGRRVTLVSAAGENPFGIHEVLMRTEAARALGGFNEELRVGAEDMDFWVRALRSGMEFVSVGWEDCLYRQRPTSMISVGVLDHMHTALRVLDDCWRGDSIHPELVGRSALDGDLGEVQRRAMVETRLFRYLGMVGFAEQTEAMDQIRAQMRERAPFCLSPKSAEHPVRQGFKRSALRNGVAHVEDLDERVAALIDSVRDVFQLPDTELAPRMDHPATAVLVENRAQAVKVAGALGELPAARRPVVLVADGVDADMGATEHLQQTWPDLVVRALPKYLLDGVAYDTVTVPAPVTWVGRLVAETAHARGSLVQVLQLPWSGLVVVDDDEAEEAGVNAVTVPTTTVTLDELVAAAAPRKNLPRVALPPPAATWPCRVDHQGSLGDYRGLERPSIERLLEMRDHWKGQRAVIIGNGPSLNKTDLDLLKGVATFGVNGIYYADERLPEPLTFYVVEDTKVFEENTPDVLAYGRTAEHFILPTLYQSSCGPEDDPVFFRMNGGFYKSSDPSYCRPRFSTNASEVLYCGQSVTIINLQLAYWFGFSEIALIGMDFSYALPQGTEVRGNLYTSAGDDPNHFDPRYFGAGKTWKDPKLNRVLANYELAKAVYESDGRRIVNSTVGGALEAFERMDLADFVNR